MALDKKTGGTELNHLRTQGVEASVHARGPVSLVGVMTDVTNPQVVRMTTYAGVASQACTKVPTATGGVDA